MRIATHDDLLEVLDGIVASSPRGDRSSPAAGGWWHELLTRPGHPLATDLPDECLVDWHARGLLGELHGARVLDVGCGNGRNARWFAEHGAQTVGLDVAAPLLAAAQAQMPAGAMLLTCDVLRDALPRGPFDIVYDSGCYHHVAPHRRPTYRERVLPLAGRRFGIVTLAAAAMDQPDDAAVIRSGDTAGGTTFTPEDLVAAAAPLEPLEIRPVRPGTATTFGEDFLLAGLFARTPGP